MRGLAQRVRARDGFKPRVPDRDRHGRSAQSRVAQPLHRFLAEQAERGVKQRRGHSCLRKMSDCAKSISARRPRKIRKYPRRAPCDRAPCPTGRNSCSSFSIGVAASCPTVSIPARLQRRFRDLADSWNAPHTERREKRLLASGRNPQQAARLGLIAGHFGDQPRARKARRARQARSSR